MCARMRICMGARIFSDLSAYVFVHIQTVNENTNEEKIGFSHSFNDKRNRIYARTDIGVELFVLMLHSHWRSKYGYCIILPIRFFSKSTTIYDIPFFNCGKLIANHNVVLVCVQWIILYLSWQQSIKYIHCTIMNIFFIANISKSTHISNLCANNKYSFLAKNFATNIESYRIHMQYHHWCYVYPSRITHIHAWNRKSSFATDSRIVIAECMYWNERHTHTHYPSRTCTLTVI